jgi:4'-phosphopantetheinyl transferase
MALAVGGDDRAVELRSPAEGVRVWALSLQPRPGDPATPLRPEDRARVATMRPGDARRLLARRTIVRGVVSGLARCPSGAVEFSDADGPRTVAVGRADRWFVSTSSSGALGVLAVAAVPVGMDVERLPGPPDARQVSEQFLAPSEHRWITRGTDTPARFLQVWVRKEAVVKCTGEGLGRDLRSFVVDAAVPSAPVAAADGGLLGIRTCSVNLPGAVCAVALADGGAAPGL